MKRLVLVFALLLTVFGATFAQEALTIGETVEGSLDENMATYTFSASAQQVFVFTLNSEEFDPYLQIESTDGDVLGSDDDSAGMLNARLVFVAPEAGDFNLVVRSYSGEASGAYVLTSTDDVLQLAFGEAVTVELTEEGQIQAFFIGEEGDVINLSATAEDDEVDTNLTLSGPDGGRVDYSEDYNGLNPVLSRIILPATGMYGVTLAPYGSDDSGAVELLLEKTEMPLLTADGLTLKFTSDAYREVVGLEITEGTLYEITIASGDEQSLSGSFEISSSDGFSEYTYFSFTGVEGSSFLYRGKSDGLLRVKVNNSSFTDSASYIITAVPAE